MAWPESSHRDLEQPRRYLMHASDSTLSYQIYAKIYQQVLGGPPIIESRTPSYQRPTAGTYRREPQKRSAEDKDCERQCQIRELTEKTREMFPHLLSGSYFIPPVWFNPASFIENRINEDIIIKIPKAPQQVSDVRGDEADRRVHNVLTSMVKGKTNDVMTVVFAFCFDDYLNAGGKKKRRRLEKDQGESAEATTDSFIWKLDLSLFPRPRDLSGNCQRGAIDVLIVHRDAGLIVAEVKAIGDKLSTDSPDAQQTIRRKVGQSLKQLYRDAEVLSYILQDAVKEGVGITKVLMLPNLHRQTVRAAVSEDPELVQAFCRCFDSDTLDKALARCVFSDQLPPIGQTVEADDDVIHNLYTDWWIPLLSRVTPYCMRDSLYEWVIARLCGPATKRYVRTAHTARAEVSTLPQAVVETSRCFTAHVLTEPQVEMVRRQEKGSRVMLTGPTGTGKRLMLLLKTRGWLRKGHTVLILSLWPSSHAAALCLYNQVKQEVTTKQEGKLLYILNRKRNLDDVVTNLQNIIRQGTDTEDAPEPESLDSGYVEENIAGLSYSDEENNDHNSGSMDCSEDDSHQSSKSKPSTDQHQKLHVVVPEAPYYVDKLGQVLETLLGKDGFVLWVATSLPCPQPPDFSCFEVARNLRRPPAVVREMVKTPAYDLFKRVKYPSEDTGVLPDLLPLPTDGPTVKRIEHHQDHEAEHVWDCEPCGEAVAAFLTEDLKIGPRSALGSALHFSDVLISGHLSSRDSSIKARKPTHTQGMHYPLQNVPHQSTRFREAEPLPPGPGFLKGLMRRNVPFDVMGHDDVTSYVRLADPQSRDCVQVAEKDMVTGLERAVVVVLGTGKCLRAVPHYVDPLYDVMGCCTSQLVMVGDSEARWIQGLGKRKKERKKDQHHHGCHSPRKKTAAN